MGLREAVELLREWIDGTDWDAAPSDEEGERANATHRVLQELERRASRGSAPSEEVTDEEVRLIVDAAAAIRNDWTMSSHERRDLAESLDDLIRRLTTAGRGACEFCGKENVPTDHVCAEAGRPSKGERCPNCDCDDIVTTHIEGVPYRKCLMCREEWPDTQKASER